MVQTRWHALELSWRYRTANVTVGAKNRLHGFLHVILQAPFSGACRQLLCNWLGRRPYNFYQECQLNPAKPVSHLATHSPHGCHALKIRRLLKIYLRRYFGSIRNFKVYPGTATKQFSPQHRGETSYISIVSLDLLIVEHAMLRDTILRPR